MRNKIIYTFSFLMIIFSCKSQNISLQQLSECKGGLYPCPTYMRVKDNFNLLNRFIGIWKGIYTDGRTYEFHFNKKENDGDSGERQWDILKGRLLVKNSTGQVLVNTLTASDEDALFSGYYFDKNLTKYQMYYSGNAECNDKGYVYISIPDPDNPMQMKLYFMQDMDIVASCPYNYKTVMPDARTLTLTKQ